MVKCENLYSAYRDALAMHNSILTNLGLDNIKRFSRKIKEIDGEKYMFIHTQKPYNSIDGRDCMVGLGLKLSKKRFYLFGFVSEDGREFTFEKFDHPCHTGGEYGYKGCVYTLNNYFCMINQSTKYRVPFQVIPHLNSAIQKACMKKGLVLESFRDEEISNLELALNKTIKNIKNFNNFLEQNKIKENDAAFNEVKSYKLGLSFEFSGVLTNLANLVKTNDFLIDTLSKPELTSYLINSLDKQFTDNGFTNLMEVLIESLGSIITKNPSQSKKIVEKIADVDKGWKVFKKMVKKDYDLRKHVKTIADIKDGWQVLQKMVKKDYYLNKHIKTIAGIDKGWQVLQEMIIDYDLSKHVKTIAGIKEGWRVLLEMIKKGQDLSKHIETIAGINQGWMVLKEMVKKGQDLSKHYETIRDIETAWLVAREMYFTGFYPLTVL